MKIPRLKSAFKRTRRYRIWAFLACGVILLYLAEIQEMFSYVHRNASNSTEANQKTHAMDSQINAQDEVQNSYANNSAIQNQVVPKVTLKQYSQVTKSMQELENALGTQFTAPKSVEEETAPELPGKGLPELELPGTKNFQDMQEHEPPKPGTEEPEQKIPLLQRLGLEEKESPVETQVDQSPAPVDMSQFKTILRWNPNRPLSKWPKTDFAHFGCDEARCQITEDKELLPIEKFDAIIFRLLGATSSLMKPDKRSPDQRYIFHEGEAPANMPAKYNPENFPNFFNWTLTSRDDSDVMLWRARIIPLQNKSHYEYYATHNFAEGKSGFAAWVVSHCDTTSGREHYVQELQKFVSVTIFGACGTAQCPGERHEKDKQCFKAIEKKYKFYISFENSLCRDYITEKFFDRLTNNILPIVYGLGDYEKYGPPHSYIDATIFKSAKALAEYLKYLDKNDTAYNEYFRWKKDLEVHNPGMQTYCDLCKKLHTDFEPKVYQNITDWYVTQAYCKVPKPGKFYLKP